MSEPTTQSLEELQSSILEDGIIDAEEVAKLKARLFDDGVIDRQEAEVLFSLNDATSGKENDSSWQGLFVEALAAHVLQDETSPGVLDEDEAAYLIEKIQGDGSVDSNELALLVHICAHATAECPESFVEFVHTAIKDAITADGVVDASEVQQLHSVIYGSGGGAGSGVDRREANLLFDINDTTTGNSGHDDSWQELFVDAIASHLLSDDASPNEVDEEEGDWLVGRIEGDGEYDANEQALLARLKSEATAISGKLKFKIEMFATDS